MSPRHLIPALLLASMLPACALAPGVGASSTSFGATRAESSWVTTQLPAGFRPGTGTGIGNRLVLLDAGASSGRIMALPAAWATLPTPISGLQAPVLVAMPALKVLAVSTGAEAKVGRLDLEGNRWEEMPPAPEGRTAAAIAAYGHTAWLAGGETSLGASNRVDIFDGVKRQWATVRPLPQARSGAGLVQVGARMLLAGGHAGSGTPDGRCWLLDPMTGVWTETAPMPTPRTGAAFIAYGNFVLAAGGRDADGPSAAVDRFDLATRSWSRQASLPEARNQPVAARLGERLVVLGGWDASGRPAGTVWTTPVTTFLP
ncbi:MAG: kelch repeat-containing protein [Candidatus Sericytochromatia bacterium]|nr:kelch repeat-containing protein [Candidatus Sericytochromatia bacterium]